MPDSKNPELMMNDLQFRSVPGACVLFAAVLLLVGIGVAVGGYWHDGGRRTPPHHPSSGRTPAEKLRLMGPIIMGVGLFIFICANTLLYEDRNQRRKRTRRAKYSMERSRSYERYSQTESNPQLTTELNIHCVDETNNPPPSAVPPPPQSVLTALMEPSTLQIVPTPS